MAERLTEGNASGAKIKAIAASAGQRVGGVLAVGGADQNVLAHGATFLDDARQRLNAAGLCDAAIAVPTSQVLPGGGAVVIESSGVESIFGSSGENEFPSSCSRFGGG